MAGRNTSTDFTFHTKIWINDELLSNFAFKSMVIRRDFYKNRFPVIILHVDIGVQKYNQMMKKVDIEKPYVDVRVSTVWKNKNNNGDPGKPIIQNDYMGILDKPYISYSELADGEAFDEGTGKAKQETETVRIALYKEQDVNAFQHGYINTVLSKFNVPTAIMYGFNQTTNGELELFMSPPHNQNQYEQDLIVPMGFYEYIEYLDQEMGIYETDYNIYMEDNEVYLLNRSNEHEIVPKKVKKWSGHKYIEPLTVNLITDYASVKASGMTLSTPYEYYIPGESAFRANLDLSRFGKVDGETSHLEGFDFQKPKEGYNSIEVQANRFDHFGTKSKDKHNFVLRFDGMPFKAKPYSDLILKGDIANNKYRITGYVTIIQRQSSVSMVNIQRRQ